LRHESGEIAELSNPFRREEFCSFGGQDQIAGHTKLPSLMEEIEKMHARPEVREILIAGKLKRWALIGQHPHAYPHCSPARARRNFSKLFSRYPQIAQRLRLNAVSAYPPI